MPKKPEVIEDTEAYRIVRRYSEAGHTETLEWKPGHEPVDRFAAVRSKLDKVKDIAARDALVALLDALT